MRTMLLAGLLLATSGWAVAQGPQAVLKTNLVRGFVDVSVNGHKVGRFGKASTLSQGGLADRDVSQWVHPGRNQVRCAWSERTYPVGDVHVSLTDNQGRFRKVAAMDFGVTSRRQGDHTAVFDVAGAPRGQTPARAGSQSGQTLMTANLTRGRVSVFLNDRKVGDYVQGLVPLDVTPYVHHGSNRVRVTFDAASPPPVGSLSLAYAAQSSRFRTVWQQKFDVFARAPKGTLTFQLP